MSSPRDRDGDGFEDDRPAGPAGWQEPAHLGGADPTPGPTGPDAPDPSQPGATGDPGTGAGGGATAAAGWQPPGWDLPAVEPDRPSATAGPSAPGPAWSGGAPSGPDAPTPGAPAPGAPGPAAPWQPPVAGQQTDVPPGQAPPRRGWGGLFGSRPPAGPRPGDQQQGEQQADRPWDEPGPEQGDRPPAEQPRRGGLFGGRPRDEGVQLDGGNRNGFPEQVPDRSDPYSVLAWAQQVGWEASDGTGPQDAALLPLLQSAPVRPGKEDRPGHVLRGRGNGIDLVAFDVLSPAGRQWVPTHAVTAAPVLGSVPAVRLTPARFWRHGTGGLLQIPSPDPEFDRRWVLLSAEDGPQVRRLAEDPVVRQTLLGSDDGDEIWAAAGFVAAVRPDANRPQLIEHHARLLAAVVGALTVTW